MSHDHGDHSHDHDHREGHDHSHEHDHGGVHVHAPASFGKAFAIGIALNFGFIVIEPVFGLLSNSVALLSDAGHNLGDVLGLAVAWLASVLVKRAPSARFTYGLRGSSILAALFNATFLLVTVGALSWEAIRRLGAPRPVAGKTVMVVAAIGILINAITAWLFASGSKDDINLRGVFLHMASDALVSIGVVAAGLVILLTGGPTSSKRSPPSRSRPISSLSKKRMREREPRDGEPLELLKAAILACRLADEMH
jgi:cobalt-zinc-cadmium efflux system protein